METGAAGSTNTGGGGGGGGGCNPYCGGAGGPGIVIASAGVPAGILPNNWIVCQMHLLRLQMV